VVSAAVADGIPLAGASWGTAAEVEGDTSRHDWADLTTYGARVTPAYFHTMGIPIVAGRDFTPSDIASAEPAVIVNQAFVRKMMPQQNPLGSRIRMGGNWMRIAGVIRDIRYSGPANPGRAEAYMLYTDSVASLQFVALQTAIPAQNVMPGVRKVIRDLDAALPITQVRTMGQAVDEATQLPREMMVILVACSILGLAMSTLGLAGVMAYAVSKRAREIGLRMALGAAPAEVSRGVVRNAGRLIVTGSAIGLVLAFVGARLLQSVLYGVGPHDPVVLAAAVAVLASIALAACAIPARRAASVQPMTALRQD
jgi:predicted permease